MNLRFIFLDVTWHLGKPSPDGRVHSRSEKNWDFELGLLSVSLDPEAWREGWAGDEGVIYQIAASGRQLRFLDADNCLANHRQAIEAAAIQRQLISRDEFGSHATSTLYQALNLTSGSQLQLRSRPFDDQVLQAALAVLASQDITIDGLWWPDKLDGEIRAERGGIYQHRLAGFAMTIVPSASLAPNLSARELPCAVLQ